MIGSRTTMPFANVTMRASPSTTVSTTNPGTSRVWSAPTSRIADQTAPAGAMVSTCLVMDAMGSSSGAGGRDAVGADRPADLRAPRGGIIGDAVGDFVVLAYVHVARVEVRDHYFAEDAEGDVARAELASVDGDDQVGRGDLD